MPEVHQQLFRCTPTFNVGVHLKCKDEKKRAAIFVFYYAITAKDYSLAGVIPRGLRGAVPPW